MPPSVGPTQATPITTSRGRRSFGRSISSCSRIHFQAPTGDYASEDVTSTERRYEDSYTDVVERFQRTYPAAKVCEVDLVA